MHYLAKSSLAASLLLAGCSVFTSEEAPQPKSSASSELKVPAGLQQPAQPAQFDIPTANAESQNIDTRSPALVLATASSSRVDEGERAAKVWFDRTDYTGDLVPFIQQMISNIFEEQGVELTAVDANGLIYTTGWLNRLSEEGFWFWKSETTTDRARYTITLEPRPHGRAASLTVAMLEHEYFIQDAQIQSDDQHRQEVALLNSIIDRVGKEEIAIAQRNRSKAPDVTLEPGLDSAGNAALLTPQTVDVTWSQLEALFGALNLNVIDKNRSIYTYYLRFEKEGKGFWSSLWGDDDMPELPLPAGEYQVVLAKHNSGTAISVRDKDGNMLSPETMLALHEPFVQAIRQTKIEL